MAGRQGILANGLLLFAAIREDLPTLSDSAGWPNVALPVSSSLFRPLPALPAE
jgi:hypothetical protein